MNKIVINRLGDTKAGVIQSDRHGMETNDPTPIVLRGRERPAAVLYYSHHADMSGDRIKYTQRIAKLPLPGAQSTTVIKRAFDAYPITFSASLSGKDEERAMDDIKSESIMTADINGDGTDELIVPRNFGTIDVYSLDKHLYGFKPASVIPKRYDYLIEDIHKYSVKAGDGLFYAINRDPVEDTSHFDKKALAQHNDSANYILVKLDKNGAAAVVLQTPQGRIEEIVAVGARNLPGSDKLDELVVCCKVEGSEDLYISRHRPDGTVVGEARKSYVKLGDEAAFQFIPQSDRMVMFNASEQQFYFLSPDKHANWIRHLDLQKMLGAQRDIQFLRFMRHPSELIALVRHHEKIFAIDQESNFYVWRQGTLTPQKAVTPLFVIQTETPRHAIAAVAPAERQEGQLLIVQSLGPQNASLDDQQLVEAAKAFLNPVEMQACEEKRKVDFNDDMTESAKIYCEEKNIVFPPMSSLADVKKQLPEFYASMVEDARQDYRICLRVNLLSPVNNDQYALEDIDDDDRFVNKTKYKEWLRNVFSGAELVFTTCDGAGRVMEKNKIANYSNLTMQSELGLDAIQVQCAMAHATVVTALRKSGFKETEQLGYYSIQW